MSSSSSIASTSTLRFADSVTSCALCVPLAVLRLVVMLLSKLLLPASKSALRRPSITRQAPYPLLHRAPSTTNIPRLVARPSSSSLNTISSGSSSSEWDSDFDGKEEDEDADVLYFTPSRSGSASSSRRNSTTTSSSSSSSSVPALSRSSNSSSLCSLAGGPMCSSPLSFTYTHNTVPAPVRPKASQIQPMPSQIVKADYFHVEVREAEGGDWHGEDEDDEGLLDLLLVPRAVKKFFVL